MSCPLFSIRTSEFQFHFKQLQLVKLTGKALLSAMLNSFGRLARADRNCEAVA